MADSTITKNAIANGLKEVIKHKSFDKITINDIMEQCGLNRQTFYYHFQDKFELADYIYYNEVISLIIEDLTYDNWDQKVLTMLQTMKKEAFFYENTLKLSVENGFRDSLFRITTKLFLEIMDRIELDVNFTEEETKFVAEFFSFGIVGVIVAWAQQGMREDPVHIARQLRNVSNGTLKYGAVRYQEIGQN